MIIYKPTGQVFKDRKEAKKALGTTYYHRLEKEKRDLIFTNDTQFAKNEVYKNTEKISKP